MYQPWLSIAQSKIGNLKSGIRFSSKSTHFEPLLSTDQSRSEIFTNTDFQNNKQDDDVINSCSSSVNLIQFDKTVKIKETDNRPLKIRGRSTLQVKNRNSKPTSKSVQQSFESNPTLNCSTPDDHDFPPPPNLERRSSSETRQRVKCQNRITHKPPVASKPIHSPEKLELLSATLPSTFKKHNSMYENIDIQKSLQDFYTLRVGSLSSFSSKVKNLLLYDETFICIFFKLCINSSKRQICF